jgi:hypothetical protein
VRANAQPVSTGISGALSLALEKLVSQLGSQRLNSSVALARVIPVSAEIRWQACLAAYRMSLAARPALMLATLIQINAAPREFVHFSYR